MRRLSLFLTACALLALWPRPAVAASPTVVEVIKVEGAIDRPLLGYLSDRLNAAEAEGAVVVLQIDTAGTLDEDGVALARACGRARRARDRLGRSRARPGERSRPPAHVRVIAGRGIAGEPDGRALSDRSRASGRPARGAP